MFLSNPANKRRRGTITPFFLIVLVVLFAALAVAVDFSFLTETRVEMQNATDAAALAAADVFVDDSTLLNSPAAAENLIVQSRLEAIKYGLLNSVGGQPLALSHNRNNIANGDIVFGTIGDPATKVFVQTQNLTSSTNAALTNINAVQINGRRTKTRGNPVGTLASRAFGLSFVDMTARSTAFLDHNVYGFQPNTSQPIPLAPIAILSDPANPADMLSWEYNVTNGNGPLTDNGLLHGIEVELTSSGSGNPNGQVLLIGTASTPQVAAQLQMGVAAGDLQNFPNNQFALDNTNSLTVAGLAAPDYVALAAALTTLQNSSVQRVFPLYSSYDTSANEVILSGFVAARVVSVQPMNGGLTCTLQPTVISVAAALTDASRFGGVAIANPYIVKVRLVE